MNLADMLSYADIAQLTLIAKRYDCECNKHSKHELIQSILSVLGRKDVFERYVMDMSLEELRFLNSILFDQRTSFSLEDLVARVQQTRFDMEQQKESLPPPRDIIVKFKQSGWLFNGCSPNTKYLFQIPEDMKLRFRDVLHRRFEHELQYVQEPEAYRDEDGHLGEDVVKLLDFIHTDSVLLNAEGVMYKKAQQQLLETLSISEAIVQKGEWRFGYGRRFHNYPNRMSLLYDYAFYQGWIEEQEAKLSLSQAGLERLHSGSSYEPVQPIYRFWLKLYKNAIPNLLSIVNWIYKCTGKWTTLDSLESVLLPYVKPFYYDSPANIIRQRIVRMMVHLGLLRYGDHPDYGAVVQITRRGQTLIQGVYVPHEDKINLKIDK
ncbi:hypothetical protein [Paenibacillus marinisediminis]